jgi:hypothetical protein
MTFFALLQIIPRSTQKRNFEIRFGRFLFENELFDFDASPFVCFDTCHGGKPPLAYLWGDPLRPKFGVEPVKR